MDDQEAENVRQNSIKMKQKREGRIGMFERDFSALSKLVKIATRFNVDFEFSSGN